MKMRWKWLSLLGFLCFACLQTTHGDNENAHEGRKILVFGGNGFMGASTVEVLLQHGDNVMILNRGNHYFDAGQRIFPRVNAIACDRAHPLRQCAGLLQLLKQIDVFDAVVDFSAYRPEDMKNSVDILQGKVKRYIYISTDSVYDVCDKNHGGFTKENDAVRPQSEDERSHLAYHHYYGNSKLAAEEVLHKQRQEGGFPFVALRLPDVVGPRDNTYRWWIYQLWIKISPFVDNPVYVPKFLEDYQMSLVYSEDVAKTILDILAAGPQMNDQAINLAYPETFTVEQILKDIQRQLAMDDRDIKILDGSTDTAAASHLYFYPSVRRGPIDVTKADSLLKFTPTPWNEAVQTTVQFFENAMTNETFHRQRDEVIQMVASQAFKDKEKEFYDAVEKAYDIKLIHFKHAKDEL